MPRVLIIQAEMKDYRVPFFTELHGDLCQNGIELKVVYSDQNSKQAARQDTAELPAEVGIKVKAHWIANRCVYQSVWREIYRADLVIVGSENKYLINPFLLLLSALRLKTVAYWGLGPNMHPDRSAFSEWIKSRMVNSADWWFAYTETVANYLQLRGVSSRKITTVQNATDTRCIAKKFESEDVSQAKERLTGNSESRIGLYCGLLGQVKEVPLLLAAARLVHERCPSFHLVIIGGGPDRELLEQAIATESWIHYAGKKFGREFVSYLKMADVFMLAGTAGLAIVDSFAAGLPVVATEQPTHPPEISYLIDGENGRITGHSASALADAVLEILASPSLLARLREGAKIAGAKYTIEAMVENFAGGIKSCLARNGCVYQNPVAVPYQRQRADNVDA